MAVKSVYGLTGLADFAHAKRIPTGFLLGSVLLGCLILTADVWAETTIPPYRLLGTVLHSTRSYAFVKDLRTKEVRLLGKDERWGTEMRLERIAENFCWIAWRENRYRLRVTQGDAAIETKEAPNPYGLPQRRALENGIRLEFPREAMRIALADPETWRANQTELARNEQGIWGVRMVRLDPAGPLVRLGLENGDLVTHIETENLNDRLDLILAYQRTLSENRFDLSLIRNGRPIEFRVQLVDRPTVQEINK